MNVTYWFGVIGEDSNLCGEEFFVEVNDEEEYNPLDTAWDIAVENFPNEELKCYGRVNYKIAEQMGLDTY